MNLYEINSELQKLLINAVDSDGVIKEEFESDIDKMFEVKEEKLLNCAKYIKNELAFAKMLKDEEEVLKTRRKTVENRVEWMKKYVLSNVEAGEKVQDSQATISTRKSKSVEIISEILIPKDLCNEIPATYKPDKKAIKAAIESGKEIEGAKIVNNLSLQIK